MSESARTWAWNQVCGYYSAKLVLVTMARQADDNWFLAPSKRELAALCEMNVATLKNCLRLLQRLGLVTEKDGGYELTGDGSPLARGDRMAMHVSRDLRQSVFERDGLSCVACGGTDDLHIDHITPQSMLGPHTEDNLQTLCATCNQRKGGMSPGEWNALLERRH